MLFQSWNIKFYYSNLNIDVVQYYVNSSYLTIYGKDNASVCFIDGLPLSR